MFSLGPCENCKRQRHRSEMKTRSAEMASRQQQFSGRSERSLPPERRTSDFPTFTQNWGNPRDQLKRLDRRHQELIGSTNIHKTSNFGTPHELINREIHHFQGGTYQIDRRTEQRATLGSRSGKRHLLSDKPFEYSNDISKSLEQLRLGSEERQHKFDWDRKDNYRLANSLDFSQRLDSRGGPRLDSRGGPRLDSRGGPRPMLDSRSGDRIRLDSRSSETRLWLNNASDPRMSNSRGSDRRYNVWSRPETREKMSTPSEKSVRVAKRRVQLRDTPQFINETEQMRTILPMIPNDEIKPILKRGKPKCVIIVHGKG